MQMFLLSPFGDKRHSLNFSLCNLNSSSYKAYMTQCLQIAFSIHQAVLSSCVKDAGKLKMTAYYSNELHSIGREIEEELYLHPH